MVDSSAQRVTPHVLGLVANNGDAYTLGGTNTWIVFSSDGSEVVIVDPGPHDDEHRRAILAAVAGYEVRAIVLTHFHDDHSDLAPRLHLELGAPVLSRDPAFCLGGDPLADGESDVFGRVPLSIVPTPGHTFDSVSVLVPPDGALLTGDTFLGGASTMIDYPHGDLRDYLESLRSMVSLAERAPVRILLPGHGTVDHDPVRALTGYLEHRQRRVDQVHALVDDGVADVDELVDRIYPGVGAFLREGAVQNVQATLAFLAAPGPEE